MFSLVILIACTAYSQQEFVHTVTAQNKYCNSTCSLLNIPELNNNPAAIIIVKPILVNGVNPNPHPVGVYYADPKKWSVINVDGTSIAEGAQFTVQYYPNPTPNQFVYVVPPSGGPACIDHASLNANPNAQVRISPTGSPKGAYFNRHPVKIEYDASALKWCIANSVSESVRSATAFNIDIVSGGNNGSSSASGSTSPQPRPSNTQPPPDTGPPTKAIPLTFGNVNDFGEKGLPASVASPTSNLDLAAMVMAKQILKADEHSLPVLLTAIKTAGFFIVDENGRVLVKPVGDGPGLGLAIYDFEAVGSLKLADPANRISLQKLAETITKEAPQGSASLLAELILTDLRTQVDSVNPYLRFHSRLVVELGKTSTAPIDLMKATSSDVKLSMLQATLLIRRLQGIFYSLRSKERANGSLRENFDQKSFLSNYALIERLSIFRTASFQPLGPCPLSGDEALVMDAQAVLLTTMANAVIGKFESPVVGKISKGLGIANIVLAWAKLVASVTMLHGEISVSKPLPLVRTLNSTPGQKRLMVARLWSEVGKKEILNCLRPLLNTATGLDFNLPTEGPLGDVAVEWRFTGENETRVNDSATRNTTKFVVFEAPKDADRNPLKQVSSGLGLSMMWLVGAAKIPTLVNASPLPVDRKAEVLVGVTLKSAKDVKQNTLDFLGTVVGVATIGEDPWGLLGLIGSAAEIGYRAPYVAARVTVPVIDHEPCTDDWHGTVTYSSIYTSTSESTFSPFPRPSGRAGFASEGSTGSTTNSSNTITLTGTASVFGKAWLADASADAIYTSNISSGGRAYCHGGLGGPKGGLVAYSGSDTTVNFGSGTADGQASGSISLSNDYYTVSIKPLTINGRYQTSHQISTTGGCPPAKPSQSSNTSSDRQFGGNDYIVGKAGYSRDRNVLSGSDTTSRSTPSQSTHGEPKTALGVSTSKSNTSVVNTITWNLRRCQ